MLRFLGIGSAWAAAAVVVLLLLLQMPPVATWLVRRVAVAVNPYPGHTLVVGRASGGMLRGLELEALRLVDTTGATRWVYRELRDRKVALFIDKLPQGVWEIRYTLRAETPGRFHAMPLLGHAMYVPEIRAQGAEQRVSVLD